MPELPEVEVIRRRLWEAVHGRTVVETKLVRLSGRASIGTLHGVRIESVDRRGKFLLVGLSDRRSLLIHLGMTGDLYVVNDWRQAPRTTRAGFRLDDGRWLVFNDPRALGKLELVSLAEAAKKVQRLGVEPLSAEFTPELLASLARGRRQPVKPFLMDQRWVAGLGNIYAAEALFEAGIHPGHPVGSLSRARLARLHRLIVQVLERAIESMWNAAQDQQASWIEHTPVASVYRRAGQPCLRCGRPIQRMRQAGRSTYYCPGCQR